MTALNGNPTPGQVTNQIGVAQEALRDAIFTQNLRINKYDPQSPLIRQHPELITIMQNALEELIRSLAAEKDFGPEQQRTRSAGVIAQLAQEAEKVDCIREYQGERDEVIITLSSNVIRYASHCARVQLRIPAIIDEGIVGNLTGAVRQEVWRRHNRSNPDGRSIV